MSNFRSFLTEKTVQRYVLKIMTVAAFIFFARFLLLFLPVFIQRTMTPAFDWLSWFLPGFIVLILYLLLMVVIFGGCTYALTRLFYLVAKKILNKSTLVFAVFTALTLLLGVLLWPYPCDTHESFMDTPNKRCECVGWTFEFYPPFIIDGTSTDYCMGWEIPVEHNPQW
jgi:hypothetical protein